MLWALDLSKVEINFSTKLGEKFRTNGTINKPANSISIATSFNLETPYLSKLVLPTKSGHLIMRSALHTALDLNSREWSVAERGYKIFQYTQRYWISAAVSSGIFHQM